MATTFFQTSAASLAVLPAAFTGTKKALSLTRGGGVVSQVDNTIASLGGIAGSTHSWGGTVAAIAPKNGLVWVTNPLNSVVLSSNVTANIRSLESNAKANYSVEFFVYQISADGSTATAFCSGSTSTELTTAEAAYSLTGIPGVAATLAQGDRLAVVLGYTNAGGQTTASGNTASGFYNGTASAASGDTFVTFVETITEALAPTATPPRTTTVVMQAVNRAATF